MLTENQARKIMDISNDRIRNHFWDIVKECHRLGYRAPQLAVLSKVLSTYAMYGVSAELPAQDDLDQFDKFVNERAGQLFAELKLEVETGITPVTAN